jgi:hypothetical protein
MFRRDAEIVLVLALVAVGLLALLALVLSSGSCAAAAYTNYTGNEDATHASWLDLPTTIGPATLWKKTAGSPAVNVDWWRFNATGGQLVEVNFRKYTPGSGPDSPDLGLPGNSGGNYFLYPNYDLWGPFVSGTNVYSYETTAPAWGGQTTDAHRRDSFSFVVPETVTNGNYFIRVYLNMRADRYTNWAYYFLSVTVEDRPSLDLQRSYDGVMEVKATYDVDYDCMDAYTIDLTSANVTGDLVRAHVRKDSAAGSVYLDAWEVLTFGNTKEHLMVNRTYVTTVQDIDIYFTADHTGQYQIRVYRDFWSVGRTGYTLDVSISGHSLDGNDARANATVVPKARTYKDQPIEMGYDNHDWWTAQMLAGDTLFKVTVTINSPSVDGQAFSMVVYDQTGFPKWTAQSWRVEGQNTIYDSVMSLPPDGTPTIFDTNTTWYVRVSVDPEHCSRTVTGLSTTYDAQFALSNRVPVLVTPFLGLYSWNEDETISIELDSHFFDPDGDKMEYVINNKTALFVTDFAGLNYYGLLNITPPSNWNGEVWWRLRANDRGSSSDQRHFIYVELKLRVLPVDDMPRSNGTLRVTCPEEGSASATLTKMFYDVDTGTMGVLTYSYQDAGGVPVTVQLDAATGAVTLAPGPDVFGTFNFTFSAVDDQDVPVTGMVELTVTPVNDVPRIKAVLPTIEMREGDASRELDLATYFSDPDGDVLTYVVKLPKEAEGKLNVYNRNNVATESVIIIELLDEDYYGPVVVNVTAKDPSQTLVAQNLRVNVANIPDAATIEYVPLGNPRAISEGANTEFKVTDILDPDVGEYGLHTYTWYLDGAVIPDHNESTYTYLANFSSSGQHTVKLEVRDPAGLLASPVPEWTFEVLDVNRAPTASIRETGAVKVTDKDKVNLTVDVSDADKDTLTIQWFLVGQGDAEDKLLGTGPTLNVRLPVGTDTIEVDVSDGKGGSVKDSTVVTVTKTEKKVGGVSMGLIGIIIAVVLAVVIAIVLVSVMGKRKKAAEVKMVKMDLDSLEQMKPTPKDYGDYEEINR